MKRSQSQQILGYLQAGKTLTPIEALDRFGVFRLAARVADLRAAGHDITTRTIKRNGTHYAEYRLSA
jgi:hypothetical protein